MSTFGDVVNIGCCNNRVYRDMYGGKACDLGGNFYLFYLILYYMPVKYYSSCRVITTLWEVYAIFQSHLIHRSKELKMNYISKQLQASSHTG